VRLRFSFGPGPLIAALVLLTGACAPAAPASPTAPKPTEPAAPAKPAASPAAAASPVASPGAAPAASPAASPVATTQSTARVDPALAPIWQGKTVTLVVAENPGGGNDAWGRLVARHIGKQLPGNPNVIVENMPGAGHRIGANHIYAAKPDGLTMGLVDRYVVSFQLQGEGAEQGVRYDANKIGWLGSTTTETQVLLVHSRAGVKEGKDLLNKEISIGHTSPGGPPHVNEVVLKAGLGWQMKSIFGYVGTAQQMLGIERGEVDGIILAWSSAVLQKGAEIKAGTYLPIVQIGGGRLKDPAAANIPWAEDLFADKSVEDKQLLALAQRPFGWSRSFLTTPGLDPNVLATMRAAFLNACADPAFLAEAEQLKFEVDPVSGERVQALIEDYLKTPRPIVERLANLLEADSPQ
jgi:tripartite-type tricarboxylate transporter receptor subunit TctC